MRATDIFDDYLEGRLSAADRSKFEAQLSTDDVFANAFNEHKQLISSLGKHTDREELKKKLKSIHEKEFGINSRVISIHREETFARKHGRTIAVAASTALIAVLSTVAILSTGGYLLKQQSNQITDLNRKVMELRASSDAVIEVITTTGNKKASYAPANYEGTAFALNNKGYVLTSFHMVNGADSIFIQNGQTERTATKLVFCDPKLDMAVLKVEDKNLIKTWQIPFALKEKTSDVGEKVFTLGYPRKDMVYGEGSLSSLSGYSNDTSMYQISIPVNPGNSGGPLLDENGYVIGVIRGKISGAEATGFAIKSQKILNSINTTAADSIKQDFASTNVKKSGLRNLKRPDQVRKINPYVFNVLIYKKD